jgi:hypothetical protein
MTTAVRTGTLVLAVAILWEAQAMAADTVPVTADNFVRAESDLYLGNIGKEYGFGEVGHTREPAPRSRLSFASTETRSIPPACSISMPGP